MKRERNVSVQVKRCGEQNKTRRPTKPLGKTKREAPKFGKKSEEHRKNGGVRNPSIAATNHPATRSKRILGRNAQAPAAAATDEQSGPQGEPETMVLSPQRPPR